MPEDSAAAEPKARARDGKLLYGKPLRKADDPVDISSVNLESGYVTIKGEIFAVSNREIQKRGASVLSFDMTDYTGSVRVNRFFAKGEDAGILGKVKPGMCVIVRGRPEFDKFYGDMVIEPQSIAAGSMETRPDGHEGEKRVELHLHTRYSTLDALPDPAKVVGARRRLGHEGRRGHRPRHGAVLPRDEQGGEEARRQDNLRPRGLFRKRRGRPASPCAARAGCRSTRSSSPSTWRRPASPPRRTGSRR